MPIWSYATMTKYFFALVDEILLALALPLTMTNDIRHALPVLTWLTAE